MPARRAVAAVVVVLAVAATGWACGSAAPRRPGGAASRASLVEGRHLFVTSGCGHCHALTDAGARGGIGPDFDTTERLTRPQILVGLTEGANGMPAFTGRLTPAQREVVADYLVAVGWRRPRG